MRYACLMERRDELEDRPRAQVYFGLEVNEHLDTDGPVLRELRDNVENPDDSLRERKRE